mmetsp:Transcript_7731/g.31983  ORF Transcript_7731/g.31983 Transcript_7731/m.31983 type:complete len:637 (+) Transcript_7731:567-2477(+)
MGYDCAQNIHLLLLPHVDNRHVDAPTWRFGNHESARRVRRQPDVVPHPVGRHPVHGGRRAQGDVPRVVHPYGRHLHHPARHGLHGVRQGVLDRPDLRPPRADGAALVRGVRDHLLGELPVRRRDRRVRLRGQGLGHDQHRQLLQARNARRDRRHVLRRRLAAVRVWRGGGQPARLVPHDALGPGAHVRHHQHHRQLRHGLRRPVVLAVGHRGQARRGAQGVHARRPRLVHHPLRPRDGVRPRCHRAPAPHRRRRGRLGPRAARRRDAHLRHQGRAHDRHHALHGHRLDGLGRVDRGLVDRGVRHLPHLLQPRVHGRRHHARLALRHRPLRRDHGRPRRHPQLHRPQPRLGLPLHGHRHRLGRHPALEHDDLEGRLGRRRRPRRVGGPDPRAHHVAHRRDRPVGRHLDRVARHERGHALGEPRRHLLLGPHPLRPLQDVPAGLRLGLDGRDQAPRQRQVGPHRGRPRPRQARRGQALDRQGRLGLHHPHRRHLARPLDARRRLHQGLLLVLGLHRHPLGPRRLLHHHLPPARRVGHVHPHRHRRPLRHEPPARAGDLGRGGRADQGRRARQGEGGRGRGRRRGQGTGVVRRRGPHARTPGVLALPCAYAPLLLLRQSNTIPRRGVFISSPFHVPSRT